MLLLGLVFFFFFFCLNRLLGIENIAVGTTTDVSHKFISLVEGRVHRTLKFTITMCIFFAYYPGHSGIQAKLNFLILTT